MVTRKSIQLHQQPQKASRNPLNKDESLICKLFMVCQETESLRHHGIEKGIKSDDGNSLSCTQKELLAWNDWRPGLIELINNQLEQRFSSSPPRQRSTFNFRFSMGTLFIILFVTKYEGSLLILYLFRPTFCDRDDGNQSDDFKFYNLRGLRAYLVWFNKTKMRI